MSPVTDAFQHIIEQAVESGVRKALNLSEATNRRLLTITEGATYLALSKREIYNMIATGDLDKTPDDSRSDFDNVFDFQTGLRPESLLAKDDAT